jgi:hypothetical protein
MAASLPMPPMAMPTLARARAGASLTPSPIIAVAPWRCSSSPMTRTLSSGSSLPCSSSMPVWAPIARTVCSLSPESSARRCTPAARRSRITAAAPGRTRSAAAMTAHCAGGVHDHRRLRFGGELLHERHRLGRRRVAERLEKLRRAHLDVAPFRDGDQALAEVVRERLRGRERQAARLGRLHERLGERVR